MDRRSGAWPSLCLLYLDRLSKDFGYSESVTTTVVNISKDSCDVYCGRPRGNKSWGYGNPFGRYDTKAVVNVPSRESAIQHYAAWIHGDIVVPGMKAPTIEQIRQDLRGKRLGCFCKPKSCHCDVLAHIADGGLPIWPIPKNPRFEPALSRLTVPYQIKVGGPSIEVTWCDEEPNFDALDDVLETWAPQITALQYKRIVREMVVVKSTTISQKSVLLEPLFDRLEKITGAQEIP